MNNHVRLSHSSQYSDQVAHVEAGDRHFPWCIKVWLVMTSMCISKICNFCNYKTSTQPLKWSAAGKGKMSRWPVITMGREVAAPLWYWVDKIYMYQLFLILQLIIYKCIFCSVWGLFCVNDWFWSVSVDGVVCML